MKYPLNYPLKRIAFLLEQGNELSLRKQFCYAFLRWGLSVEMKDKIEFVQLAKQFRKGRVGQHRTLLERKARKLYRSVNNYLAHQSTRDKAREWGYKSKEKEIGVHSPEYKAKLKEHNKRIRQILTEKIGSPTAKHWIIHAPDNSVFEIVNLKGFCRERGLTLSLMTNTANFPGTNHEGWRVERGNPDWRKL